MKKVFLVYLITIGTNCTSQKTKEEFVQLGLKYHNTQNYDVAISSYSKALALDSLYFTAYVNRANSYFEKKEYTKALADNNKAIALDITNPVPYNNRAMIYQFQEKYDQALSEYNKAISLKKDYYEAYVNKIRTLLKMKKPDEAKAIVVYVEKEFPTVSDSYIVAFIYYALLYDVHNALKELDNAVKIDPKDEKALDHRASYKDEIADEKGAIADFNKLIDLNPTEAKYFYGRSSANFDLKNYDAVIDDCKKAVALDDNFYKAYVMLGNIYDTYGDAVKSIANYEKAISICPANEFAYNELGGTYYLKANYKSALDVFNRILEKNPNLVSSLEYRADCNFKLANYDKSIEDYSKLISLNPDQFKNYMNRANVEIKAGKKTAACTDMTKGASRVKKKVSEEYLYAHDFLFENCRENFSPKMLKVNDLNKEALDLYADGKKDLVIKKYDEMIKIIPDSSYLYFNRGKFKRELDQQEEAILDYKKAVQLDKKNVDAWTAMGISYQLLNQYDNAIKSYLEAIKADSSYAIAYNDIAQAYREKKENGKALQYLELAVQKDPNYIKAYFSLGEVYIEEGNKEKGCYNFKRAEALGEPRARIKILSECE